MNKVLPTVTLIPTSYVLIWFATRGTYTSYKKKKKKNIAVKIHSNNHNSYRIKRRKAGKIENKTMDRSTPSESLYKYKLLNPTILHSYLLNRRLENFQSSQILYQSQLLCVLEK